METFKNGKTCPEAQETKLHEIDFLRPFLFELRSLPSC